ncbi:type A2 lantipeptide [Streptomyces spirodelae]|uniref:Type A2 lantipeptide n=1 Tax=Streptomyces spirodelae TaxID=2812904 RepID=A0ABS3WNA5_9ACTN|nr:type A2 lantipeptide [Streptomyces spirodelae]MBO8184609.1 type A2 lantipeptide [Streptomyces spirodelae]
MRHQIETAELADAELDAVAGGVVSEQLHTVANTVGGVEGVAGDIAGGLGVPGIGVASAQTPSVGASVGVQS